MRQKTSQGGGLGSDRDPSSCLTCACSGSDGGQRQAKPDGGSGGLQVLLPPGQMPIGNMRGLMGDHRLQHFGTGDL